MRFSSWGKAAVVAAVAGTVVVAGAMLADAATPSSPTATSGTGSAHDGAGPGTGRGGANDTPVTGDELAKVTAAVKAKDSTVTVNQVRKDPDGSYDVLGTTSGNPVMYDVSADLKTITKNTHDGKGGPDGKGGRGGPGGAPSTQGSSGAGGAATTQS